MPRPSFALTDDQAGVIAQGVRDLEAQIPFDPRSHRAFVRSFIALVHTATGKLFSPEIYRRLLDAYTPNRRPSISTIAKERDMAGTRVPTRPVQQFEPNRATDFVAYDTSSILNDIGEIVEAKLAAILQTVDQVHNAQVEFYQYQLEQVELELKRARTQSLADAADLAAARQAAEQYRQEAETARASIQMMSRNIDSLTSSADELRKFSLLSIEESRGETRVWKARCAELELQRQREAQSLEALRRSNFNAAVSAAARESKP